MAKNIRYYYLPDPLMDNSTNTQVGEVFRPKASIRVSYAHGRVSNQLDAIVDSGADGNLFPLRLGTMLGINFIKIKPKIIYGIGGVKVSAYSSSINIWINGTKYSTHADFCDNQHEILLGRQGFFDLFKSINFVENKRFFEIEL